MQYNNVLHSNYIESEGPSSGADESECLIVLE